MAWFVSKGTSDSNALHGYGNIFSYHIDLLKNAEERATNYLRIKVLNSIGIKQKLHPSQIPDVQKLDEAKTHEEFDQIYKSQMELAENNPILAPYARNIDDFVIHLSLDPLQKHKMQERTITRNPWL